MMNIPPALVALLPSDPGCDAVPLRVDASSAGVAKFDRIVVAGLGFSVAFDAHNSWPRIC
jgi:hypothetical protein